MHYAGGPMWVSYMAEQLSSDQWYSITEYQRRPQPVPVERYTDDSVWIKGQRHARIKTWEGIFQTETEAWEWVISKAVGRRDSARRSLDVEQKRLDTLLAERNATCQSK